MPIKLTKPYEVKNSVISLPEASPAPTIVPIKTKAIWNILYMSFFNNITPAIKILSNFPSIKYIKITVYLFFI